ncbi:hypothetical protein [Microbaculum sp. FT89]|uniref:hypothetical protein n=1 Tax=Microbaculum sp. FT89 TaxID=3447298 RepID=UPI003F52D479
MIVVTGMHRSGTSMTAMLLSELGAPFGDPGDLIAADQWNQSGYYESKEAVGINLRLLLGLGVDIDNWIHPPANPAKRLVNIFTSGKWRYLLSTSEATLRKRADALAPEIGAFGTHTRGLFVKDPRFAVTYGLWHDQIPVEGTVFCFRHPEAVRRSISRRDLMPKAIGTRMWLQHNRDFIRLLSGDEPVLLVDYDQFFTPQARERISRLATFVSGVIGTSADVEAAVSRIDLNQRHHRTADLPIDNREAKAAYEALRAVSADQAEAMPAAALRERLKAAGAP